MSRAALCAVLLAAAAVLCAPQEAAAEDAAAQSPPTEGPTGEAESLFLQTLGEDIDTAGYYELVAWCRSLGLSDKGSRQVLQQRLAAHYGLGGEGRPEPEAGEGPRRLLEIRSAETTEYFTVQETGDDQVVLEGDVVVELQEEEAVHRIRARRVVLNQTQNLLMAEGDIQYTLLKGQEEESFRGERLTFDVNTWEGVFFGGSMEVERPVEGKTIRFRFYGEAISRLADDTVVLEQGTISSCDLVEDPHYSIRARRIWVLAPDEWAIAHAVLYIGRVPVLYLPFFFHPGQDFVFHPAFGYRDREGSFVQTTTYLVGQKKREASALSFLAATEESGAQYAQARSGLFLRTLPGEPAPPEGRFLKLFVDYYSRLGGFTGVQGQLEPFSLRAGLARSRTVRLETVSPFGAVYTPGFPSDWNEGWLLGLELPFRYGLTGSWSGSAGPFRLAARLEQYSDPFFTSDFFDRSEELGLLRMLGGQGQSATAEGQKSNLTWELSGQADFSSLVDSPWLTRLSLPSFTTRLLQQSKKPDPGEYSYDPEYDPNRLFYYPASQRLPGVSAQMEGTLLEMRRGAGAKAAREHNGEPAMQDWRQKLRPPAGWAGTGEAPARAPEAATPAAAAPAAQLRGPGLRRPEPKPNLPTLAAREPASLRVGYQVRPTLLVDQSFNSAGWKEPEDVEYDVAFTSIDGSGTTSLGYDLRVLESLLTLNGSLQYNLNYRGLYRQSLDQASWEDKVVASYGYNEMALKSSTALSYMPFLDDPAFGGSSLSYALGWTLLRYADDRAASAMVYGDPRYESTVFAWDPSAVSQHQARALLAWNLQRWSGQFSLAAELPARTPSLAANLQFEVWLLKTVLNTVYREEGTDWGWQPLVVQQTLSLSERARAAEELRFDVQSGFLDRSLSSFTWGGFNASFTAERLFPKSWNDLTKRFDTAAVESFRPSYVNVGFTLPERELYLWRNRVRLETQLSSAWSMDIQEFTTNSLDFSFTVRLFVHEFLELAFTSVSYNNRTFRYFPALAEQIPPYEWVNPLVDLARSFNFFQKDQSDRYASAFKLKKLSLQVVHHLHDWDLSLIYEGRPVLRTDLVPKQYVWGSTLTILVQWAPLPEMRRSVKYDDTTAGEPWSLRG